MLGVGEHFMFGHGVLLTQEILFPIFKVYVRAIERSMHLRLERGQYPSMLGKRFMFFLHVILSMDTVRNDLGLVGKFVLR